MASTFQADGVSNIGFRGGYDGRSGNMRADGASDVSFKSTVVEARVSQLPVLASITHDTTVDLRSSQVVVKSMFGRPAFRAYDSQIVVKVSTQVEAKFEYLTQYARKVGAQWMPEARSSQVAVLSLVRSNPDRRKMRAYPFFMDGHWFYVLHLGETTTLVFDTVTRKWSEWNSQKYNNWRPNYIINWKGDVIGGSLDSNIVFNVSPIYDNDVGDPIISTITGGVPVRWVNDISCDAVMVTSSAGMTKGSVSVPSMQLRSSDDYGVTWNDWGSQDLSVWNPTIRLQWQSLGQISAPGRIFEITDTGAAKRINSLRLFSRDINQ